MQYPALYEALLSRLSRVMAVTTADLDFYADTLAGPLRRSLEQLSRAVDEGESQLAESMLARVPSYTSPLQSFQKFWAETFGASPETYEIPASLVEVFKILGSISDGFSVPGCEETLPVANESLPAPGQDGVARAWFPASLASLPARDLTRIFLRQTRDLHRNEQSLREVTTPTPRGNL